MIISAAVGAAAHRDHVARLAHLVVDPAKRRRHLVAQRPGDDHHVRLTGRRARRNTKSFKVIARHVHMDHLDRAAGEAEGHPPQRSGPRPGEQVLGRGDHEPFFVERLPELLELLLVDLARNQAGDPRQLLLGRHRVFVGAEHHSHSSAPFFHAYARPSASSIRNSIIATQPDVRVKSSETAHGNRNAASRSNTMNRIATR